MNSIPNNLLALALLLAFSGCGMQPLHFDEQGLAHGTGTKEFYYQSGALLRSDKFKSGELEESTWFKPDGSVVTKTVWIGQSGVELYLYEDGTPRLIMFFQNGLPHGKAYHFSLNGDLTKVLEYEKGQEIAQQESAAHPLNAESRD